jgi:uncharacterized DUF497 family protein
METFEWNQEKDDANFIKLGIRFEIAVSIFDGPILEQIEVRMIALGAVDNRVLTVVYTIRGDICRIISARVASRSERNAYHQAVASRTTSG